MNQDDLVLSEVHLCKSKNKVTNKNYITRFSIKYMKSKEQEALLPSSNEYALEYDSDGDINTNRAELNDIITLTIIHCNSTHLKDVGKQVWAASLLMADFIIYSNIFKDCYCIELGAGVGICSLLSSFKASHVFSTDKEGEILSLAKENYATNSFLKLILDAFKEEKEKFVENVSFRKLNWFNVNHIPNERSINLFTSNLNSQDNHSEFSWTDNDNWIIGKTNVIIAADCIYDEILTEKIFHVIFALSDLSNANPVVVFMSVEKRLNFTLEKLDIAAPSYEHFCDILQSFSNSINIHITNVPLDFPIYIDYERSKYLELWRIDIFK